MQGIGACGSAGEAHLWGAGMKALVLLSGGFDSAVAAEMMQQKGIELVGLHFSYEPVTDDSPELKVRAACKQLGIKELMVVKAGHAFAEIASKCQHRLYYVLSKRFMLQVAEHVAKEKECSFLITGDNLAQVGSQTLPNLCAIDQATTLQVVRPLLGFDKREILDRARAIKTYELSKGPEVCDCLGPKYPATSSSVEQAMLEEEKINAVELKEKYQMEMVVVR